MRTIARQIKTKDVSKTLMYKLMVLAAGFLADATAVAKAAAAAAAAAKAYTAAGCNTDVAKDGCAELQKAKVAADAKVDLAERNGASGLAVSIAAALTGTIAAMFA